MSRNFTKSVFILSGGTAAAQAIGIIASLFLARIYSPDDFGILALVTSATGFITIAASGRYELGFMLTESRAQMKALFGLIFRLVTLVSVLCLLVFSAYYFWGNETHSSKKQAFLLIAPAVFFASISQVITVYLTREKQFKRISSLRILEVLANVIPAFLFGSLGALGLVGAYSISQAALGIALLLFLFNSLKPNTLFTNTNDSPGIRETAKVFRQFPTYNVSQGLLDAFQMSGILWIGSSFLSLSAMGFYGMVMRLLQLPFGLIIRPLAQVYFGEISEAYRQKKGFYTFSKRMALKIAFAAIPALIAFPLIAEFLFEFLLGPQWKGAGNLAAILAFWIVADSIRSPLSQIPVILSAQKKYLFITLAGSCLVFGIFGLSCALVPKENYLSVFIIFTAVQVMYNLYLIFYCLQLAKQHDRGISNN